MAPQPPVLLCDNIFDRTQLYPAAVLSTSSELTPGNEAAKLACYRREKMYWQAADAGDHAHVDFTRNTAGGSGGVTLSNGTGAFARAATSHVFCFLVYCVGNAALNQAMMALVSSTAGNRFTFYRSRTTGFVSVDDGGSVLSFAVAPPVDAAWHTLIFKCDAGALVWTLYIDGVKQTAATPAYAGHAIATETNFILGAASGNVNNLNGKLGTRWSMTV
jgi:hypothetical protein